MSVRPPRRGASEEEHAFFREAMKDTRPLSRRSLIAAHEHAPVKPFIPISRASPMPVHLTAHAPAIGGHDDARLRRGRGEVQGKLDLHGLTQEGAYRALLRFLMNAQAEGKRLVLVITGKGGVLRAHLPLWLGQGELKPLIGGMSEAHASHGGSGAFYVAIRRRKKP